jgi:hypothetical protein
LQLSNERGAIQDKRSFSTSFFVFQLSKTLTALVKTQIRVVKEKVATKDSIVLGLLIEKNALVKV